MCVLEFLIFFDLSRATYTDDIFSVSDDVDRLQSILQRPGTMNNVTRRNIEEYDHLSFLFGKNAYYHIYSDIVKNIESPLCSVNLPDCLIS